MFESAREFVSSHNEVSRLVQKAEKFSINLPVVGKVSVPPPQHLAFYGVLGVLGVTELIPWPVAVLIGAGHALTVRRPGPADASAPPAEPAQAEKVAAEKAPAKKATAKKAPAKKVTATKAAAKKAPATKSGTSKSPS